MARWTRVALILGGGLLAVVAVPVGAVASAFVGLSPIADGTTLAAHTKAVKDGYVSSFLIDVGGGARALVDAGNDPTGAAIDAALKAEGLTRDAVVAVFLTHGHPDHVAACGGFPKATVYAGAPERALLEGRASPLGPLPRLFGASKAPCGTFTDVADDAIVPVGETSARAYALPGHTAGSTAWLLRGVLFFGDAASATSGGEVQSAPWVFSDDVAEDTRSLVALSDRIGATKPDVQALAFAHTGSLPPDALAAFAAKHR